MYLQRQARALLHLDRLDTIRARGQRDDRRRGSVSVAVHRRPLADFSRPAFPAITVDLVFVQGAFGPATLNAVAQKLKADVFLMTCPSERLGFSLEELRARVIMV